MAYPPAMQSEPDEPTWVLAAPNTVVTVPDLDAEARGGGPPSRRHRGKPRRLYEVLKRIFDVSVVVASSPLWLPIYGLIALAILVTDGRPIHFRDRRVGRYGDDLSVIKFRTMHASAKTDLAALLAAKPELQAEFR